MRGGHLRGWGACCSQSSCPFPPKVLQQALDGFGEPWDLSPGDGAFYGPKVSWGFGQTPIYSLFVLCH